MWRKDWKSSEEANSRVKCSLHLVHLVRWAKNGMKKPDQWTKPVGSLATWRKTVSVMKDYMGEMRVNLYADENNPEEERNS